MKLFERWKYEEIELTFGTERDDSLSTLADWLTANEAANDFEMQTLSNVHAQLVRKVEAWNEDELKFFFIAHVVNLVNFSKPKVYSSFSQRTISAVKKDLNHHDVELRGRIEFFVALGEQIPRQPFFFLHEYKPLNKTTPSDPLGQLLIAMMATQTFNEIKRPLYGTFVRGSFWHFVVLEDNKYAVSDAFDGSKIADLLKIFAILKKCKEYIESWVK
jgi:hypothetical protein